MQGRILTTVHSSLPTQFYFPRKALFCSAFQRGVVGRAARELLPAPPPTLSGSREPWKSGSLLGSLYDL